MIWKTHTHSLTQFEINKITKWNRKFLFSSLFAKWFYSHSELIDCGHRFLPAQFGQSSDKQKSNQETQSKRIMKRIGRMSIEEMKSFRLTFNLADTGEKKLSIKYWFQLFYARSREKN